MFYALSKLLHLSAAIVWLGGMTFMLMALRPVAGAQLQPPQRAPLLLAVMGRFFPLVWLSIAGLLLCIASIVGAELMSQPHADGYQRAIWKDGKLIQGESR